VGRSAGLLGRLGLVALAFGFIGTALVSEPFSNIVVLAELVLGAGCVITYLVFGFEDFRSLLGQRSTRYGAGAFLYTLLFVVLIGGVNYLSWRHHHRWDTTEAGVYTLAPQSKKVASGLSKDLVMTAFVEGGQDEALNALLGSYRYAAPDHVKYELVDPDKKPELATTMKITSLRSVNLQYGNESFVVTNPTEETITNGIIRITGGSKKTVYFAEGDGEADTANAEDARGYSAAKTALEQENYEVKTLVLPSVADKIPDDATALVIPGPTRPLSEHATQVLDAYLKNGGHLLVMIGPRDADEGLAKLLADWGVKLGDDIVIDQELRLFQGPSMGIQPITKTYGVHPITESFRDYTIYPQTRTVAADATGKKGLSATELVKTSPTSRALGGAKVEQLFTKGTAQIDDTDRKGPLPIAVAVTAKLADLGVTPPASDGKKAPEEARLVVFGTAQFADNSRLTQRNNLNQDLFLNSIGWLVGQSEVVSIRSRAVRASKADLTPAQNVDLFMYSVLVLPMLLIMVGVSVSWFRKSR